MNVANIDRLFAKYRKIQASCDHTNHTEAINGYPACFCAKLCDTIQHSTGITGTQFSDLFSAYILRQNLQDPAWISGYIETRKQLAALKGKI